MDCTSTYQGYNFETPEVVNLSNGRQLVPTILDYGIARGMYYHNLRITSNIKYLSKYAFNNTFTDNLIIEEGLKYIDDFCFGGSKLTTEVVFPNSLYIIGSNVFQYSEMLEKISFGNGLFEIGEYSFSYNPTLKEVILPNNLNRIGKGAFNNCTNLKKFSIPRLIDRCSNAFNGCPNIETIDIHCPFDHKIFTNSFQDVDKEKCIVIVPKGRSAWFRKYSSFRDFKNIIERDDERVTTAVDKLESATESDTKSSSEFTETDPEEVYSISGVKYGSADNVPSNEIYIVTNPAGHSQKKIKR